MPVPDAYGLIVERRGPAAIHAYREATTLCGLSIDPGERWGRRTPPVFVVDDHVTCIACGQRLRAGIWEQRRALRNET